MWTWSVLWRILVMAAVLTAGEFAIVWMIHNG